VESPPDVWVSNQGDGRRIGGRRGGAETGLSLSEVRRRVALLFRGEQRWVTKLALNAMGKASLIKAPRTKGAARRATEVGLSPMTKILKKY
jgi:hypothetical protein